jgi:hypothetical protein
LFLLHWKASTQAIRTTIKRGKFSSDKLRENSTKNISDKEMVSGMYHGS